MAWTNQQIDAIEARNSSVIVSAAAGSGKTAVLTERLIQLIADRNSGVRADRIVVVTFTNDAASELKKRLDSKLHDLISQNPSDTHLLRQQVLLQSARISTINAFCFDVLRDNITGQGVTSGFNVMDSSDEDVLKSQAMDELLDYYSSEEYDKISFLFDKLCVSDGDNIKTAISQIDEFLSSEAFRDIWLEKAVEEYKKGFENSIYSEKLMNVNILKLRKAMKISDECVALVPKIFPEMRTDTAIKMKLQAEKENDQVRDILKIFESGRYPDVDESKTALKFEKKVTIAKSTEHNAHESDIYTAKRNDLKKLVQSAVNSVVSVKNDYNDCVQLTEYLAEAVKKYHEIIWEHKEEKNALSFDDGERLVLEMFADFDENGRIIQSETAKRLSEYYDIIMIDEYQDSNNKQDLIFKLISKNFRYSDDGQPMYGDNVFLVGDVKQSIYGFRLANPRNFINTVEHSEKYTKESTAPNKAITLNKNFRSSPEVIDFINYLFSEIMSEKCGDIEYTDDEKLYFGAEEYHDANAFARKTHIAFIPYNKDEKERNYELEYTTEKIAEMLENGTVVEERDGKTRPCRPSDFCILVRSNALSAEYAKALNDMGIPAKGSDEKGYLKSLEIAVLIDLLRIINDPLLDIPLAAVLSSPMYTFTSNDLAYIKSFDRDRRLYSLLRDIADGNYLFENESLFNRIRHFLEAFDRFRLDSVTMTVGELITSIYDKTDFISVMQIFRDGEKKRANLRALVQHAANYESASSNEGSGGLGGFLRHIDRILAVKDINQSKISASTGDYVTVQTFHSSKGLEYKFVFIAENSKSFQYDDKDLTVCSSDGRIGYIVCDRSNLRRYRTVQRDMIITEEKLMTKSEEMRLLYVGLTRAKQKLFINLKCDDSSVGYVNKAEECIANNGKISGISENAETFAFWMWTALYVHPKYNEIAEKLDYPLNKIVKSDSDDTLFEYEIYEIKDKTEEDRKKDAKTVSASSFIVKELEEIMSFKYDDELTKLPAKMSVTQISHQLENEKNFDFSLQRPKFISESTRLTGAERGTAMHTFFQYCDFENAVNSPEDEVKRLLDMGYLNSGQAKAVNTKKISAFFNSELYKRVISADSYIRERKFMVAVSQLELREDMKKKLEKSDGMIKGIIDLMFEENGSIVLVDYKSDRGVSAKALAERYRKQLDLYKSAVEVTMGKPVSELYLYSIELEKTIKL